MSPAKINFKMYQGSTFSEVLRWESSKKVYKSIDGITNSAPCVVTSTTHGIPNGWRTKITNAGGMKEINSTETWLQATKIDANNIELNSINSIAYTPYTNGGVLEYNEPVDLTSYTARMQIREKIDSDTFLVELTTENGGIVINQTDYTVTIIVTATATALLSFNSAVYSLELQDSTGVVTPLANGTITLVKEVTR